MVDNYNPTNQFHPYKAPEAVPQSEVRRSGLDKIRNMNVRGSLDKVRGYAQRNPGALLGGIAAAAIGLGLLQFVPFVLGVAGLLFQHALVKGLGFRDRADDGMKGFAVGEGADAVSAVGELDDFIPRDGIWRVFAGQYSFVIGHFFGNFAHLYYFSL